jgi:hypothetical protein
VRTSHHSRVALSGVLAAVLPLGDSLRALGYLWESTYETGHGPCKLTERCGCGGVHQAPEAAFQGAPRERIDIFLESTSAIHADTPPGIRQRMWRLRATTMLRRGEMRTTRAWSNCDSVGPGCERQSCVRRYCAPMLSSAGNIQSKYECRV